MASSFCLLKNFPRRAKGREIDQTDLTLPRSDEVNFILIPVVRAIISNNILRLNKFPRFKSNFGKLTPLKANILSALIKLLGNQQIHTRLMNKYLS